MKSRPIVQQSLPELRPDQWRMLRHAGWAAVAMQILVLHWGSMPEILIFDFALLGCYLATTLTFVWASRRPPSETEGSRQVGNGLYRMSGARRRFIRGLVLLGASLFLYGGSRDPALFYSSGMVFILYIASFIWIITRRPPRRKHSKSPREPLILGPSNPDSSDAIGFA